MLRIQKLKVSTRRSPCCSPDASLTVSPAWLPSIKHKHLTFVSRTPPSFLFPCSSGKVVTARARVASAKGQRESHWLCKHISKEPGSLTSCSPHAPGSSQLAGVGTGTESLAGAESHPGPRSNLTYGGRREGPTNGVVAALRKTPQPASI